MTNIINKVIQIEDVDGNTLFAFEIDQDGNIIDTYDCNIADEDYDGIFTTNKALIRLQKEVE